jgi:2-amino-4-hydroxy-6-hydroxymethyldihydropteridine diphosphokinase
MRQDRVPAYIGIGSNLGDAQAHVRHALVRLGEIPGTALGDQSSLFRSAPIDAGGEDYINAVALLQTGLPALDLLRELQNIEQEFGRERPYRNAPRTLDLDLLLYGHDIIATPDLAVPHPRMTERAFVLIPLLQLNPVIIIPGKGPAHAFIPGVASQIIQKT